MSEKFHCLVAGFNLSAVLEAGRLHLLLWLGAEDRARSLTSFRMTMRAGSRGAPVPSICERLSPVVEAAEPTIAGIVME